MSDEKNKSARRENRKSFRVALDQALRVVMGSIGAEVRYEMVTFNISMNGFFLDFEKPGRFPFTPASIMEVWLELEEGKTIFFNGKMTRIVKGQGPDGKPGIAVKIVQIDRENDNVLREFVMSKYSESQEKSNGVA